MKKVQLKSSMTPKELYLTFKTEVEPTNLQTLLTGISDYTFTGDFDESTFKLRSHEFKLLNNRNRFYIIHGQYKASENGTIIDIKYGMGKINLIFHYVFYGIIVAMILFLLLQGLFNDVIYIGIAGVVGITLAIMLVVERLEINASWKRDLKLFKTLLK